MGSLWVLSGLLATLPVFGEQTSNAPIAEKIQQEQKTLEVLKDKIERKKKQAVEAGKKQASVLQSVQELDDELMVSRKRRSDVNGRLKDKDRDLERLHFRLDEVQARIRERRGSILARIRAQYMEGRLGYLKAFLSADSPVDLQRRFQYLSALSQREFELLEAHRKDLSRLKDTEQEQADARNQMLRLKESTDRALARIQGLKRKKRMLLASITRQKEAYEEAAKEYERSAVRVDSLIQELEKRRKAASRKLPSHRKGIFGSKGTLPWPATGEVVSLFGRQKHPTFETYVQRKGIEIRTHEGTEIRAVMAGSVAYADWLKGYGLVLILDHGNGFFSLYAHASKLLTKAGEQVQSGEVIGETGDTGMTGDNTLYFELREGAKPVDPLLWLAKRP